MNKIILFTSLISLCFTSWGQFDLKNAVIVGQFDKPEDRYAIEVNVTEIFSQLGIKSLPLQNIIKQGGSAMVLIEDSVQSSLKLKGFDTYVVINVRGYDRTFKPSLSIDNLEEALNMTSIYKLYRDESTSVSFEFIFFRNNVVVFRDILKCGNISDRISTIKRFKKKLPKRMKKKWKVY
jgi:hypothetical protein